MKPHPIALSVKDIDTDKWHATCGVTRMFSDELKARTKKFALDVIDLTMPLSWPSKAAAMANQLLRSGTAIGAHYRSASKAKSNADFAYKIGMVEEEADE